MNKIILRILVAVSIIIIVLGICVGNGVKNEVKLIGKPTQNVYIDGTDATAFTEAFVEIGSGLLGIVMIIFSIVAVACMWVIYGIILLISIIIKKYKQQRNKSLEQN